MVFGQDTATAGKFPANLDLSSLDGTNGFKLSGVAVYDRFGLLGECGPGDVDGGSG